MATPTRSQGEKEETKLNNFLLDGFLIEDLGAKILKIYAAAYNFDFRVHFGFPRISWLVGPVQPAGTVRERVPK
jgi:hypothetical protein